MNWITFQIMVPQRPISALHVLVDIWAFSWQLWWTYKKEKLDPVFVFEPPSCIEHLRKRWETKKNTLTPISFNFQKCKLDPTSITWEIPLKIIECCVQHIVSFVCWHISSSHDKYFPYEIQNKHLFIH